MTSNINIADIRKDYSLQSLSEKDVDINPIRQFTTWWNQAINSLVEEANAMTLATCTKDGIPDARIVLLKGFSEEGFTFFTNYNSNKARELEENPFACLVFFWRELERQVRIEGNVKKVSPVVSDDYFSQRPRASRIGAWSSPQSEVIVNREVIESNVTKYQAQFPGDDIPRPSHWGGYIVLPVCLEFWQGRRSRLHDRIRYSLDNSQWKIDRLAP